MFSILLVLVFCVGHLALSLCLPLVMSLCLLSWLGVLSSLNCHLDPDPGHSQGTGFILRGFFFVDKLAKWSYAQKKGQYVSTEVA